MNEKFILQEKSDKVNEFLIQDIDTDGYHISKYIENQIINNPIGRINHILSNAREAMKFFASPKSVRSQSKILGLGKVQSGKTAFFIATIAYAFDNAYDLCILFGGTKNNLLEQNIDRVSRDFSNNEKVKILNLVETDFEMIENYLTSGYKVILTVLKNVSGTYANLHKINAISKELGVYKTLIIDDEADEHTPGAPKVKVKNPRAGITHDVIVEIQNNFSILTILFVTATPQANLLISTLDELSPDYITLVEPGKGYTGGEAFHTSEFNRNVIRIEDTEDFKKSIPSSYKYARNFFMLAVATKAIKNDTRKFSMLIHPSSFTRVQNAIVDKLNDDIDEMKNVLSNSRNLFYHSTVNEFRVIFENEFSHSKIDFDEVINYIVNNLEEFKIFVLNTSQYGKISKEELETLSHLKYKIYIGGNMLGRGVTLENLCVTYIFRDSKVSAVDTLYQRARWFGYKQDYFDICRVFMPEQLSEKFVAAAENERDLWQSLREYLTTKINLKYFRRIFTLNNDKLILTRKTVAKTVVFERIKPGYNYDTTVAYTNDAIQYNLVLYQKLLDKYKDIVYEKSFSDNNGQKHLIISDKYSNLYEDFISKYRFQINSKLGNRTFEKLYEQVNNGQLEDEISIIVMRHNTGQFRSLNKYEKRVKELPQGYDPGSNYSGDRTLEGFEDKLHIQIHLVYTDRSNPADIIPILALNNPITKRMIRYATGDNYYAGGAEDEHL